MARGTILSTIRNYVKYAIREAVETNSPMDAEINNALANKQRELCDSYFWAFLQKDWNLSCTAASRYFTLPTTTTQSTTATINFEHPVQVYVQWGSLWLPVDFGIGADQYSIYEGTSRTADPIQRWRMAAGAADTAPDLVEVWPAPTTTQTLRFSGQRQPGTFSSDSDKADLDDQLLSLSVAADYMALRGADNAQLIYKKAQDLLIRLRAANPAESGPYHIGSKRYGDPGEKVRLIAVT